MHKPSGKFGRQILHAVDGEVDCPIQQRQLDFSRKNPFAQSDQ